MRRCPRISRLTDAYRIIDAAFSHLTADGRCTDGATAAAARARYGDVADLTGHTGALLRATTRGLLTTALTARAA